MISFFVDIIASGLVILGAAFVFIGSLGLIRFKNFWHRLHASGLIDTLGMLSIMLGLIVREGFNHASLKLFLMMILLIITIPTTTHVLANAAFHSGLKPQVKDKIDPYDASSQT